MKNIKMLLLILSILSCRTTSSPNQNGSLGLSNNSVDLINVIDEKNTDSFKPVEEDENYIIINVYFVRHAEGTHNDKSIRGLKGQVKRFSQSNKHIDPSLTAKGKRQSKLIGNIIKEGQLDNFPPLNDIDIVFSSPHRRAIQTTGFMFGDTPIVVAPYIKEKSSNLVAANALGDNKLQPSILALVEKLNKDKKEFNIFRKEINFDYVTDKNNNDKFSKDAHKADLDNFIYVFLTKNIKKLIPNFKSKKELNFVAITHSHNMMANLPTKESKSNIDKPKNNSIVHQRYTYNLKDKIISISEENPDVELFATGDAIIFRGYN